MPVLSEVEGSIFLVPLAAGLAGLLVLALPHARRFGRCRVHRIGLEPRSALSTLALYGASGNVLDAAGAPLLVAALVALVPALAAEVFLMRPLVRLASGFQGRPSTPLACLAAEPARAVSAFANGRGMVEVVHDGRVVQLVASLVEEQRALSVRVGERLRIVEVDADRQRVTVSLI